MKRLVEDFFFFQHCIFRGCGIILSLYLSPWRRDPLQPLILGAAPQDTRLLGFGFVVLPAHAVGHHHGSGPGISAAAEDTPLPQATAAGLGALGKQGGPELDTDVN